MTIDVHINEYDDVFIDNIEDIVEDTIVGMFVLHPKDLNSLQEVQELSNEYHNIFYAVPSELLDKTCEKCIAVVVSKAEELETIDDRVVMIEELNLDETLCRALSPHKGIILNATKSHDNLKNFFCKYQPEQCRSFR